MKKLFVFFICLALVLSVFAGCSKSEKAPEVSTPSETESVAPLVPDIEYTDILAYFGDDIIGKPADDFGLPEDLVFLTGDQVIGYDYVCIGSANGSVNCYFNESGIYSIVFGSEPYETQDEFSAVYTAINQAVADKLEQKMVSPVFSKDDDDVDKLEALFAGQGVMIAEYQTNGCVVSVTGCGVNGVATVVVECSSLGGGAR